MMWVLGIGFWVFIGVTILISLSELEYVFDKTEFLDWIVLLLVMIFAAVPFSIIGIQTMFDMRVSSYFEALYAGNWLFFAILVFVAMVRND